MIGTVNTVIRWEKRLNKLQGWIMSRMKHQKTIDDDIQLERKVAIEEYKYQHYKEKLRNYNNGSSRQTHPQKTVKKTVDTSVSKNVFRLQIGA